MPLLRLLASLVLLTSTAITQAVPGEFIVANTASRTLLRIDERGNTVEKLAVFSQTPQAVMMDERNTGVIAVLDGTPDLLVRVTGSGNVTTLATLPAATYNDIELDQDGSILILSSGTLFRFALLGNQLTTIVTGLGFTTCATVDDDTGHYIVGNFGSESILQVHRRTLAITTIASGTAVERINDIDHDPRTGNYIFVRSFPSEIVVMNRSGNVVDKAATTADQGVWVDDETGVFYTTGGDQVVAFRRKLTVLRAAKVTGMQGASLARFASRNVVGLGNALANGIYRINANFPESPSASYGAAISTAMRPGIPIAGRTIDMFPTQLFFASASGALENFFTSRFVGTLSNNGNAFMQMTVPKHLLVGRTLYITANAVNPSKPGGLDLGNTISFTPRP